MELIEKYDKAISRLDVNDYSNIQKRKRDVLTLKNLAKRYNSLNKQYKAYQQAIARFNVDFPNCAYDLQGYVLEEQNKLNKEIK